MKEIPDSFIKGCLEKQLQEMANNSKGIPMKLSKKFQNKILDQISGGICRKGNFLKKYLEIKF